MIATSKQILKLLDDIEEAVSMFGHCVCPEDIGECMSAFGPRGTSGRGISELRELLSQGEESALVSDHAVLREVSEAWVEVSHPRYPSADHRRFFEALTKILGDRKEESNDSLSLLTEYEIGDFAKAKGMAECRNGEPGNVTSPKTI